MANRDFKNVKRMISNISEDTYEAAESGGGGSEYVDHITLAYGTTELTEEQIGFLLQNPYAYIVYVDTPFYPNKFNGAALGYVTQVNSHNNGASLYIESMVISTRNGAITIQKWTLATNVTPTN